MIRIMLKGRFEKLRLGFELLMFYVLCLTQIYILKTQLYTKTQVLLKPGLKNSVIPP